VSSDVRDRKWVSIIPRLSGFSFPPTTTAADDIHGGMPPRMKSTSSGMRAVETSSTERSSTRCRGWTQHVPCNRIGFLRPVSHPGMFRTGV